MKQLFSTKLRIILVLVVLITAALSVVAGLTNQSVPDLVIQGLLTPFRSAATALTNTVERYYSYMFKYEALEAENQVLKAQIAQMEDVARQADATSRENERLRKTIKLQNAHDDLLSSSSLIMNPLGLPCFHTWIIVLGSTM